LLAVRRLIYDDDERPVQWLHGLYRPDRYTYEMQLSRVGSIDAKVWVSKDAVSAVQLKRKKEKSHAAPSQFHLAVRGPATSAVAFPLVAGAQPKAVRRSACCTP
jgi:hypothetical protein